MKKIKNILLTALLLCSIASQAQTRTISGFVKDEIGKPLEYIQILIKGTTFGAETDENGYYIFDIPDNAKTIVYERIYNDTIEMPIPAAEGTLPDVIFCLEENKGVAVKVLTGYESDSLREGKVPVNHIVPYYGYIPSDTPYSTSVPSDSARLVIRGQDEYGCPHGFDIYSEPLYILDGKFIRDLQGIWPSSIKSFDIIKNAAQFLGRDACGGVIVVKTKNYTDVKLNFRTDSLSAKKEMLCIVDGKIVDNLRNIPKESIETIDIIKDSEGDSPNRVIIVTLKKKVEN